MTSAIEMAQAGYAASSQPTQADTKIIEHLFTAQGENPTQTDLRKVESRLLPIFPFRTSSVVKHSRS
jgi:hypothetical protein